jgi:LysR family transcriptional regulator, regulator for bpeEF and oprC
MRRSAGELDIDKLWAMEVFVRVAESGSFSRAAESLHIATATVTTCVRKFERHLGVTLISRDTRRFRLTEQGQMLLVNARETLRLVARTEEELHSQVGELGGTLHVDSPVSIGHRIICPLLPAFAGQYPAVKVSITLVTLPRSVIEHAVDVAVRFGEVEDADLVARPLFETAYVVCCTPAQLAALPPHPSDLDRTQCMGLLPGNTRHPAPWRLERDDLRVAFQPEGSLHFNTSEAALAAARSGHGLAYVPEVLAAPELESGVLVRAYPEWTGPLSTVYLATTRHGAMSAKVRAFIEFMCSAVTASKPLRHGVVSVRGRVQ